MTALAKEMVAEDVFDLFSQVYDREKREEISLNDYLRGCRDDPMMYATAPSA